MKLISIIFEALRPTVKELETFLCFWVFLMGILENFKCSIVKWNEASRMEVWNGAILGANLHIFHVARITLRYLWYDPKMTEIGPQTAEI